MSDGDIERDAASPSSNGDRPERSDASSSGENTLPASIDLTSSTVAEASKTLSGIFGYATELRQRTFKSASAFADGIRESSGWLVPSAFRNSQSYTIFIRQMLDYAHADIDVRKMLAGVKSVVPEHLFVARKSVDNLFDMTALAAFHISPLTVIAIYGHLAFGNTKFVSILAHQLKSDGILTTSGAISDVNMLLTAIGEASKSAEGSFRKPPISADSLKKTISSVEHRLATEPGIRQNIPMYEIDQLWRQMEACAKANDVALWGIAAALAIDALGSEQTVKSDAPRNLELSDDFFSRSLMDSYWRGLRRIECDGLLPTLSHASEPYLDSIWQAFSMDRTSWRQQLLDGELLKWGWSKLGWKSTAEQA